jgi:hypothetical protein
MCIKASYCCMLLMFLRPPAGGRHRGINGTMYIRERVLLLLCGKVHGMLTSLVLDLLMPASRYKYK